MGDNVARTPTAPLSVTVRPARFDELNAVDALLAESLWFVGPQNLKDLWLADPNGFFVAVRRGNEIAGFANGVALNGETGAFGLFIVRRKYRKRGVGAKLWTACKVYLAGRNIAATVVDTRVDKSKRMGFGVMSFKCGYYLGSPERNLKVPAGRPSTVEVLPISKVNILDIVAYDKSIHVVNRKEFITNWVSSKSVICFVARKQGKITGYGVARQYHMDYRITPLYADNDSTAKALLVHLLTAIPIGYDVGVVVPDRHMAMTDFLQMYGLSFIYYMHRMYTKAEVDIRTENVYGLTDLNVVLC